jgi:DDE family transposase
MKSDLGRPQRRELLPWGLWLRSGQRGDCVLSRGGHGKTISRPTTGACLFPKGAIRNWRIGTPDERCFLPIHVYDAATGAPVVVILRPGKTPSGVEVRKLLSRLIGRIRRHWPDTASAFAVTLTTAETRR